MQSPFGQLSSACFRVIFRRWTCTTCIIERVIFKQSKFSDLLRYADTRKCQCMRMMNSADCMKWLSSLPTCLSLFQHDEVFQHLRIKFGISRPTPQESHCGLSREAERVSRELLLSGFIAFPSPTYTQIQAPPSGNVSSIAPTPIKMYAIKCHAIDNSIFSI